MWAVLQSGHLEPQFQKGPSRSVRTKALPVFVLHLSGCDVTSCSIGDLFEALMLICVAVMSYLVILYLL